MWRLLEEHARGRFGVSEDDDWAAVTAAPAPGTPGDACDLVRFMQRVRNLQSIDSLAACGRPAIANQGLAMAHDARN